MNSFLLFCAVLLPVLQISADTEVPLPDEKSVEENSCLDALDLNAEKLHVAELKIVSLTKDLQKARKQAAQVEKALKLKESGTSIIYDYETKEYEAVMCEWKWAQLSCRNEEKIEITYANYGRQDYTTCQNSEMYTKNCSSNKTMPYATNECNGKANCFLAANFRIIGEDPCFGTYKYLRVTYKCVNPSAVDETLTLIG